MTLAAQAVHRPICRWFCIGVLLLAAFVLPANRPAALAADLHPFALPPGFVQDILARDLGPATAFAMRPDGSILIARKHGSVKVWRDGKVLEGPFIDISGEVNNYGDRGLMGIAVHPNFPNPPYVYLAYAYEPAAAGGHDESGARTARVLRVEADSRNLDKARDGSRVVLLGANEIPGNLDRGDRPPYSCQDDDGVPVQNCLPVDGPSHTVDGLVFGPDGALYVSAGDGTLQPDLNVRAQNLDSLAGKVLRINPRTGAGYADNPYYDGDVNSNRSKVFALGLRNPYRFTFDPAGQLVVGDVGGERWEEINRADAGANLGWPCFEGPLPNSGDPACAPVLSDQAAVTDAWHRYPHADGYSAAIGGDFYTGDSYPADYRGAYFFADHNRAALLYLPAGAGAGAEAQVFATNVVAPVQITQGPDGSLYVLSFVDGTLSRIRYTGDGAPPAGAEATPVPAQATPAASPSAKAPSAEATPTAADLPTVRIVQPASADAWRDGDEITVVGEAFDVAGEPLPGASLAWAATLHHNDHVHPDFFHGAGITETLRYAAHAPNAYLELCLTATDADARSATSCMDLRQAGEDAIAPAVTPQPAVEPTAAAVEDTPKPAPEQSAQNGITSPAAGAILSGTVAIEGVAAHPTFRKWQLDLLLDGNVAHADFLALGEEPVPDAALLAEIDTSRYPNGEHKLRLRVVYAGMNYEEFDFPVTIAN